MLKPFPHASINKLQSHGLGAHELVKIVGEPLQESLEILYAQGLKISKKNGFYYYDTTDTNIADATFCIVDIETNGSKPDKHQIIEIGAVKVKNMAIVGTYESLVECHEISPHISEITGIYVEDTHNAPKLDKVLLEFKEFIGDDIFVAHDVKFDYKFISRMLEKKDMLGLMNRSLCTIDLTERTISSYRYGLSYLNKELDLYQNATHHRALSDAITTAKLFKRTLNVLPEKVVHVEELIKFSKEGKRLKRPKFDPHIVVKEVSESEE